MRIGELAERAGINAETVRYYEKSGLLPPPPRRSNGYRCYDESHLEQLGFIRHCRALDMSLRHVRQLLDLVANPEGDCASVDHLIDEQLARVRTQLASLQKLEVQLTALRTQCRTGSSVGHCGILHELVSAAHREGCVCHPDADEKQA